MMGLNAVAAGCGSAVSRRPVPALLTAAARSTSHTASLGPFFDRVTELMKVPEDALQEFDDGIDR